MDRPQFSQSVEAEPISVPALDGYRLGAYFYAAPAPCAPRVAVVHGGIRAARYRRFASFLAASGIPLVYDYRGIGLAAALAARLPRRVEDWAEYDCGGAIAWMRERYPDADLVAIAHSIGALLVGGRRTPPSRTGSFSSPGTPATYGDYHPRYRVPMTAVWHGLMPAVTLMLGYFPAQHSASARTFPQKSRCNGHRGARPTCARRTSAALRARAGLLDRSAALQRPALVVSISDDAFATEGGKRLLSYYPRLFPLERSCTRRPMRGPAASATSAVPPRRRGTVAALLAQLEPSPN